MEAFWVSTLVVAIAEIGDKTQLLALVLAIRYRRPVPVLAGLTVATLANHALAAGIGQFVADLLHPDMLRWLLAASFAAMAAWALIPERFRGDEAEHGRGYGPWVTSTVTFFLLEMGDKTQIATVALAAKFDSFFAVLFGSTLGLVVVTAPIILFGHLFAARIRLEWVRLGTAAMFFSLAAWVAVTGIG